MRIIGADLSPDLPARADAENTLVLLDDAGRVQTVRHPRNLPAIAVEIGELAGGEPFLVGVNLPVVVPVNSARNRPVEGLVRRKLGYRLGPGGRAALSSDKGGVAGEALLAALAAAGFPCLPYPDRDRRRSGMAEMDPGLILKVLLWEDSLSSRAGGGVDRGALFRSYSPPDHRASPRSRSSWSQRTVWLDVTVRALSASQTIDLRPARDALVSASSERDLEGAASLLDACLVAATARRYLEEPETCMFLGEREGGYTILPADGVVRTLALGEPPAKRGGLFPKASLRQRLGEVAELRPVELLEMPGRPQRVEAVFRSHPLYEFDNLDEMLWWKHCRHVSGPPLPKEGLQELAVALGKDSLESDRGVTLRLVRSRHRTLSFRFDPPGAWRARVPTRDGRTYPFRVLRATFETSPS